MEWIIQTLLEYFQWQKGHSFIRQPILSLHVSSKMLKKCFKMDLKWMFLLFLLIHLYSFICLWKSREEINFVFRKIILYLNADSNCFHKCFLSLSFLIFSVSLDSFLIICSPYHFSQLTTFYHNPFNARYPKLNTVYHMHLQSLTKFDGHSC